MAMAAEHRCSSCGASNLGTGTACLMCGAALASSDAGRPAHVGPAPDRSGEEEHERSTLWKLVASAIVIGGIVLLSGWVTDLFEKEDEDPRPSWERWNLKPRAAPKTPEKTGFPDRAEPKGGETPAPTSETERLIRELMTHLGVSEVDARAMLESMGADDVREVLGDERGR